MSRFKCDKCGMEFERGIMNMVKHQFEDCGGHIIDQVAAGISIKTMPFINPTVVTDPESAEKHISPGRNL